MDQQTKATVQHRQKNYSDANGLQSRLQSAPEAHITKISYEEVI